MRLSEFEVVVFDLDDTLYLERDYAVSGFKAVGRWLHERRRWNVSEAQDFTRRCIVELDAGRRGDIFDEVFRSRFADMPPVPTVDVVSAYRRHRPHIRLQPDANAALDELTHHRNVWIITDGPIASQRAKVRALKLTSRIRRIIYTDRWGRAYWKPHARAFREVQETAAVRPDRCIYVGDHPVKDFVAPRRLGWATARIRRTDGLHAAIDSAAGHEADLELPTLWPMSDRTLNWPIRAAI